MDNQPRVFHKSASRNMTRTLRNAQRVATILLGLCVPFLLILLVWDLMANPSPVPAVVTIAGLVMLCFFFSYVFVVPDDLTSSATDRTLSIASKIFVHTRKGMTPDAAMGACQIILPETLASAMCITDGKQVLASWGEGCERYPTGQPVVLDTTLNVVSSKVMSVFSRDANDTREREFFPRLRAGIVAPLTVRDRCVGTLELYYPRFGNIDMRQTALATGFADLISTQLASFELERCLSTFPTTTAKRCLIPRALPRLSARWSRAFATSTLCRRAMARGALRWRRASIRIRWSARCRPSSCSRC